VASQIRRCAFDSRVAPGYRDAGFRTERAPPTVVIGGRLSAPLQLAPAELVCRMTVPAERHGCFWREALSLRSRPRTAMENAEEIPLHFELIPILAPPGRNSHGIRVSRLFVRRLAQRGARPAVDVRETTIEESARCRGGAFGA
jgi:hypothetical protein